MVPSSRFVRVISAPRMTPPCLSLTVPTMLPCTDWACAVAEVAKDASVSRRTSHWRERWRNFGVEEYIWLLLVREKGDRRENDDRMRWRASLGDAAVFRTESKLDLLWIGLKLERARLRILNAGIILVSAFPWPSETKEGRATLDYRPCFFDGTELAGRTKQQPGGGTYFCDDSTSELR